MKEKIVELNVKDITDFPKHPFKINNDINYEELKNSRMESAVKVNIEALELSSKFESNSSQ